MGFQDSWNISTSILVILIDASVFEMSCGKTDRQANRDKPPPPPANVVGVGSDTTCVRQAESPQSQIGGRVRDAAETVFNGVDCLMNHHVLHAELQHNDNNVTTQQLSK